MRSRFSPAVIVWRIMRWAAARRRTGTAHYAYQEAVIPCEPVLAVREPRPTKGRLSLTRSQASLRRIMRSIEYRLCSRKNSAKKNAIT
jgi:hypothetical protein